MLRFLFSIKKIQYLSKIFFFASAKDVGEVCGKMSAGKPNENHKTFKGNCNDDLKCIKNKCRKTGEKIVSPLE
jgi:hypothetical protein